MACSKPSDNQSVQTNNSSNFVFIVVLYILLAIILGSIVRY